MACTCLCDGVCGDGDPGSPPPSPPLSDGPACTRSCAPSGDTSDTYDAAAMLSPVSVPAPSHDAPCSRGPCSPDPRALVCGDVGLCLGPAPSPARVALSPPGVHSPKRSISLATAPPGAGELSPLSKRRACAPAVVSRERVSGGVDPLPPSLASASGVKSSLDAPAWAPPAWPRDCEPASLPADVCAPAPACTLGAARDTPTPDARGESGRGGSDTGCEAPPSRASSAMSTARGHLYSVPACPINQVIRMLCATLTCAQKQTVSKLP